MPECEWISDEQEFNKLVDGVWEPINHLKERKKAPTRVQPKNHDKYHIKQLEARIEELETIVSSLEKHEPTTPGGLCSRDMCIQCVECERYQNGDW